MKMFPIMKDCMHKVTGTIKKRRWVHRLADPWCLEVSIGCGWIIRVTVSVLKVHYMINKLKLKFRAEYQNNYTTVKLKKRSIC